MKNSDYWKERFAQLEKAQNAIGASAYSKIERQYKQAQRQIEMQIESWHQRFAKNNSITLAEARQWLTGKELKEFQWDVREYIKHGEEYGISGKWAKELENASAKFHISKLEALKIQTQQSLESLFGSQQLTLFDEMGKVYKSGYYHTAFELQRGFNIGWDIAGVNQSEIEKILVKPWAPDKYNFSERIWKNKTKLINEVHKELTQNILTGADPQKAINAIAKKMNTSKYNAGRLVMTEEAYFSSVAQRDCFNELDVEQYEIVATLDSHTSEICQELDGKHFPMKDYQAGVTAPPFHVFCRSTTVPYFDDNFGQIGQRAARDEKTGKTYYVPDNMTYKDWKQAFVDGGSKEGLTNLSECGKIRVGDMLDTPEKKFEEFLDRQTGFTDDFKKDLKEAFANGTLSAQKAYVKYMTPDAIASTTSAKGNFFRPSEGKVYINVKSLMNDPRGPATSFYHEVGHLVDYKSQNAPDAWSSVKHTEFVKAIHKDFDDMVQEYMKVNECKRADAYTHFIGEFSKDPVSVNQISDLFCGMAKNRSPRLYGHEVSYWNERSLAQEAFAHLYECQFDKARRDLMQQYFPTALAEFEKMLGGLV